MLRSPPEAPWARSMPAMPSHASLFDAVYGSATRFELLILLQVRLKRPWSDGTTAMIYDPLDFLTKLAALVPSPRSNQIRFHGVFAPHARLRSAVVPTPAEENQNRSTCTNHGHTLDKNDDETAKRRRYGWAKLMARVFSIDVLECPRCPGRLQMIAFITQPRNIRKILESVGLPADSPRSHLSPPHPPKQTELELSVA